MQYASDGYIAVYSTKLMCMSIILVVFWSFIILKKVIFTIHVSPLTAMSLNHRYINYYNKSNVILNAMCFH